MQTGSLLHHLQHGLGATRGPMTTTDVEIVNWFLANDRYPADTVLLEFGCRLIEQRLDGNRGTEIYAIPAVGRVIFTNALLGLIHGEFQSVDDFPEWLQTTQAELAEWLREVPRRKSQYFLNMASWKVTIWRLTHATIRAGSSRNRASIEGGVPRPSKLRHPGRQWPPKASSV